MGCNQDFSTKVERVTHDSDPRKIQFEQLNRGVTTKLGQTLDMSLITAPTEIPGTPASVGTTLADLTGGNNPSASNVVRFDNLNAGATIVTITPDGSGTGDPIGMFNSGATTWTITFTDATTLVIVMGYAVAVATSIAQAQDTQSAGTLDFSPAFALTAHVGKTIDKVDWISTHWTNLGGYAIDYGASSFKLLKNSLELNATALLDTGLGTTGPGMGWVVTAGDKLYMTYDIVSVGVGGSSLTFAVNAATIKALAIAQGVGTLANANIDFTSTIGAGTIATALGGGSFGTGVPTANLQHAIASVAFTGDNGAITLMDCTVSITDSTSAVKLVGGGFNIDNGGSDNAPVAFTAAANPSVILGFNITSTGNISNTFSLTLTPPGAVDPIESSMTGGATRWLLHFTDASTLGIVVASTDLLTLAAAQGASGVTTASIDLTAYSNLHMNAGKTIDSVDILTLADWTTSSPGGINLSTSSLALWFDASNLGSQISLNSGASSSAGPGLNLFVGNSDTLRLVFDFHGTVASPVTITVPVDATALKYYAGSGQIASNHVLYPSPSVLLVPNSVFASYIGWTVTGPTVLNGPNAYGPAGLGASQLTFELFKGATSEPAGELIYLETPIFNPAYPTTVIDSTTVLRYYFQLYPTSTPAVPDTYGPIVFTEAYELRNRNQAAMRFVVTPPVGYDTEAYWTFVARGYVSQGHTAGEEFWTPAPLVVYDENATSTPGNGVVINALSHRPGTPPNYGGTIVELPINTSFTGPWNYWRLLLQPITVGEGGTIPDFTGWTLQIIANAREL